MGVAVRLIWYFGLWFELCSLVLLKIGAFREFSWLGFFVGLVI